MRRKLATGADPERHLVRGGTALGREQRGAAPSRRSTRARARARRLTIGAPPDLGGLRRRRRLGRNRARAAAAAAGRRARAAALVPGRVPDARSGASRTRPPTSNSRRRPARACSPIADTAGPAGNAPAARGRRSDAARLRRRAHVHLPHPHRLPLLAAVERAGDGGDVQAHARARVLAEARPRRARPERGARDRRASRRSSPARRRTSPGSGRTATRSRSRSSKPSGDFLDAHLAAAPLPRPAERPRSARCRPTARCRRPGRTTCPRPRTAVSCCCRTRATAATGRSTGRESSTRSTSRRRTRSRSSIAASSTTCRLDFDGHSLLWRHERARRPLRAGERRPPSGAGSATSPRRARFLDYIVLNANRPLFRDVRLRRAVNYALDRPRARSGVPRRAERPDRAAERSRLPGRGGLSGRRARPHDRTAARRRPAPARGAHLLHVLPVRRRRPRSVAPLVKAEPRADRDRRLDRAHRRVPDGLRRELEPGRPPARDELRPLAPRPRARTSTRRSTRGPYSSALGPGPWNSASFRRRLEAASVLRGPARTACVRAPRA